MGTRLKAWGDVDRLLAVALTKYEASLCDGCGQPLHESMDPQHDRDNRAGPAFYEAPEPVRCHACTALEERQKQYTGEDASAARRFMVRLVRRAVS